MTDTAGNQIPESQEQLYVDPSMQQAQILPEEVLVVWEAPSRAYKKRDREFYTTIGIIVFLMSIILFFAGQFLLIAVIVAFAFLSYVLASIPPERVSHAITTYGIRSGDHLYHWGELGRFWFSESYGQRILNIEYFNRVIGRLVFLLGDIEEEQMKSLLINFLPNETPLPTFVENAANWLQKKFPMDKTS